MLPVLGGWEFIYLPVEVKEGRQPYLLLERVRNQAFSERSVELKINKHWSQAVCNYCAIALYATLLSERRLKKKKEKKRKL